MHKVQIALAVLVVALGAYLGVAVYRMAAAIQQQTEAALRDSGARH